ncbi:uncharacterized protein [Centruroides vittatus]|uniref:uncharacterized protein n=1 Tax=Centruroides vittatus TaxID=120091 RepID=UPI00350F048C
MTIDNKLSWNAHLESVKKKVGNLFQEITKVAKKEWSTGGTALTQIYKGVVIPITTYGAQVWGNRAEMTYMKRKIISFQRKFLLRITGAYRTTSNDALCVMAGLLPMDLEISQRRDIRKILKEKITYEAILTEKDEIEYQIKRYQQLKRYEWKKIQIKEYSPLTKNRIYTDGSRTPEGVGAAYIYISNNREQYNRKIKLDKRCNNYQAELIALEQAVSWISNNMKNITITICTDSLSVLKALNDDENKHELIDNIRKYILANKNNISFSWVKAHMGDPGNERVDSLAKEASSSNMKVVYKKLSERYVKREIKNKYIIKWQKRWTESTKGRELFEYLPDVHQRIKNKNFIINYKFTRFMTAHGDFAEYHNRFHHNNDGTCEICGDRETPTHLLFECIKYENIRNELRTISNKEEYNRPIYHHEEVMKRGNTTTVLVTIVQLTETTGNSTTSTTSVSNFTHKTKRK